MATRGKDISAGDYNFVQIDTRTDEVKQIYDEKVMNFAINDQLAYLYNFNYTTQDSQIKVFNLQTGTTLREDFITDETEINTPYGIHVNPYSGNIYITDAYNYLVRGDVLCFNPQGKLIYRLTNTDKIPIQWFSPTKIRKVATTIRIPRRQPPSPTKYWSIAPPRRSS